MASLYEQGLRLSKNALFSSFLGRSTKLMSKPLKVLTVVNEVADKLADNKSKDNKFTQLFHSAQALVRLVRSHANGEYKGIKTTTVVSGLAVLLYVLSPIDLIPDFVPVLGWMDDLSLVSWFAGKFQGELASFRAWEAEREQQPASEPARGDRQLPAVAELGHS
jgi:uncharacterized membrane protein YkvA (DUF1232 family)